MVTPFVFALQCHLSPLSHCKLKPPKKRDTKIHAVLGVDISTVSLICLIEDCNIPNAICYFGIKIISATPHSQHDKKCSRKD